ncbi:MAG: Gldg family protein [Treponema sp.]
MKKEYRLQALLFCAVLVIAALISQRLYIRIDATRQQTYTLSAYTKSILDSLDGTFTITWFRSYNIDGYVPALQYAEDLLNEYQVYAQDRCRVVYKDTAAVQPQRLQQLGFVARQIEKSSGDTKVLQNLYSGLLCEYRGESRVIPFLSDVYTIEADIARFITEMNQDAQNRQAERSVYVALPPDTAENQYRYVLPWLEYAGFIPILLTPPFPELKPEIPLLVIGSSYFDSGMLTATDVFINKQGSAAFFVSANTVDAAGTWQAVPKKGDGLLELLARSGFILQHNLVMDPLNFRMTLPSADRTVYEYINYPFWPQVYRQESPVIPPLLPTGKALQLFWPSELVCTAARGKTPAAILSSSPRSVLQKPPYDTDPRGKQLAAVAASEHESFPLAAAAAGTGGARVLVVADEYCLSTAIEFTNSDANMDLMVNAVHWLFRQDVLLELKNKQPAVLPFRFFESDTAFNRIIVFVRILNLAVIPLLIIAAGIAAFILHRRKPA